jgi:hypothetical protein
VDHFKFISNYSHKSEVIDAIKEFVDLNCTIEDDESEEDLYNDLILKVF